MPPAIAHIVLQLGFLVLGLGFYPKPYRNAHTLSEVGLLRKARVALIVNEDSDLRLLLRTPHDGLVEEEAFDEAWVFLSRPNSSCSTGRVPKYVCFCIRHTHLSLVCL